MIIIRPIDRADKNIFIEFSFNSTLGLRNLPRGEEQLTKRIAHSMQSFSQNIKTPGQEEYLFVLEDLTTGKIGGISGILTSANPNKTFCFRTETLQTQSLHPAAVKEIKILRLIASFREATEICSLYLQPSFRHSGQGRLLSLSRFLFIASHRERFRNEILAELRGYIDHKQIAPFWEAIGKHFCTLSFIELMAELDQGSIDIREILPHYPIYISLLSQEVQEMIGKTHESSIPALNMLQNEGFTLTNEVDAIEAGPTLIAETSSIRTIKNSRTAKIIITNEPITEENPFILSNTTLNFRACYGHVTVNKEPSSVTIHQEIAEALRVKNGNEIRYVSVH